MYEYTTQGTCSTKIKFDIRDNRVYGLSFTDGCPGNLSGLSLLAEGMEAAELIRLLKGVRCGAKKTSCPDQLARALEKAVKARS
jgi:uncharacterized protein (TIGR03905 family)